MIGIADYLVKFERLERMERVAVRAMTVLELEHMRDNGFTCAVCDKIAVQRVVGGGNFRLCDEHAEETVRGLRREGLLRAS